MRRASEADALGDGAAGLQPVTCRSSPGGGGLDPAKAARLRGGRAAGRGGGCAAHRMSAAAQRSQTSRGSRAQRRATYAASAQCSSAARRATSAAACAPRAAWPRRPWWQRPAGARRTARLPLRRSRGARHLRGRPPPGAGRPERRRMRVLPGLAGARPPTRGPSRGPAAAPARPRARRWCGTLAGRGGAARRVRPGREGRAGRGTHGAPDHRGWACALPRAQAHPLVRGQVAQADRREAAEQDLGQLRARRERRDARAQRGLLAGGCGCRRSCRLAPARQGERGGL